ncbi:MAG TPA: ABC transporter substrate-binding protein, partial [Candidatus Methanofastidiosa archaeon]|nr:ABC transporter substrate-binding protein [Candidatus Methanofastidiosa archaeon]
MFATMIIVLVSVAGCINGTEEPDPAGTEDMVLNIGTTNAITSENVFSDYYLNIFYRVCALTLTTMDEDGSIVGLAASHWDVSEDLSTWKFYVNDGYTWSDGTPLDMECVAYSFEWAAENGTTWLANVLDEMTYDESENSITFNMNTSYARFDLEMAAFPIYPKHVLETIEDIDTYTNTGTNIGFGPFYISSIDLTSGTIVFEPNEYWGSAPNIDSFEIHIYENIDTLSLALEKGDIDVYYNYASSYPYANIAALEDTGDFEFLAWDNIGLTFMGLNLNSSPLDDLEFRTAISYALNYEEMVALDALGYGSVPQAGFISPAMEYYKDTYQLTYDPDEAASILDAAGYELQEDGYRTTPEGEEIELRIVTRSDYQRLAEFVKEYCEDVGIKVSVEIVDKTTWIAMKDGYDYDMTITRSTPWGMLMHANWGSGYFDSRRSGAGVLHILDDEEYLALCDNILATTDAALLRSYAYELQDY